MENPKIKIGVQYQPLRKGAERPEDWGASHGFNLDGASSINQLPNVGDFVSLNGVSSSAANFLGKVKSRLFSQFTTTDDAGLTTEIFVSINIVIEETDDDWGKLIKE